MLKHDDFIAVTILIFYLQSFRFFIPTVVSWKWIRRHRYPSSTPADCSLIPPLFAAHRSHRFLRLASSHRISAHPSPLRPQPELPTARELNGVRTPVPQEVGSRQHPQNRTRTDCHLVLIIVSRVISFSFMLTMVFCANV